MRGRVARRERVQHEGRLCERALGCLGEGQVVEDARDEPGVEVAGSDLGAFEQQLQKGEVGLEPEDRGVVDGGDEAAPCLIAGRCPRDDLREHRVVVGRHVESVLEGGIDPDAVAGGMHDALDAPTGRQEPGPGIFGVHAHLDRVTVQVYVDLSDAERFARRNPQLLGHEVEPGDHLGDGVLDLQARVHLHEEEVAGAVAGHDELYGAGADVADAARGLAGGFADAGAGRVVEERRRGLFDDLLVSPLQRALALAEVDDGAVLIGKDLHLDVPRRGDVAFEEEGVVAEGCRGLAPRRGDRRGEPRRVVDDVHALAAAACGRLDQHGEVDLRRPRDQLVVGQARAGEARNGAHAARFDGLLGRDLVAHHLDRLGRRPDEDDAGVGARAGELGVLGEEPEPRVDRLRAGAVRGIQHPLDRQVALARGGGPEAYGFVGEAHVHGSGVGVAVDGDRADAEAAERADDPHRDLAAVGDEDFLDAEGVGGRHGDHIRKTP